MRFAEKLKKLILLPVIAVMIFLCARVNAFADEIEIGTTDYDGRVEIYVYFDKVDPKVKFSAPSGHTFETISDFVNIEHYESCTVYYIDNEEKGVWKAEYEKDINTDVDFDVFIWENENPVTIESASMTLEDEKATVTIEASYSESYYLEVYSYALTLDGDEKVIAKTLLNKSRISQGCEQTIYNLSFSDLPDGDYQLMLDVVGYASDGSEHKDVYVFEQKISLKDHNEYLDGTDIYVTYDTDSTLMSIDWSKLEADASEWTLTVTNDASGETVYSAEPDKYTKSVACYVNDEDGDVTVTLFVKKNRNGFSIYEKKVKLVPTIALTLETDVNSNSTSAVFAYNVTEGKALLNVNVNDSDTMKYQIEGEGKFSVSIDSMATNEIVLNYGYTDDCRYIKAFKVSVDIVAPTIDLFAVDDVVYTGKKSIVITGATKSGATLTVNGKEVMIASDGTFSYQTDLSYGDNLIEFEATDAYGNKAYRALTAVYSTSAESDKKGTKKNIFTKNPVLWLTLAVSLCFFAVLAVTTAHSRKKSLEYGYKTGLTLLRLLLTVIKDFLGLGVAGGLGTAGYFFYQSEVIKNKLVGSKLIETLKTLGLGSIKRMISEHQKWLDIIWIPLTIAGGCLVLMIAIIVLQNVVRKKKRQ